MRRILRFATIVLIAAGLAASAAAQEAPAPWQAADAIHETVRSQERLLLRTNLPADRKAEAATALEQARERYGDVLEPTLRAEAAEADAAIRQGFDQAAGALDAGDAAAMAGASAVVWTGILAGAYDVVHQRIAANDAAAAAQWLKIREYGRTSTGLAAADEAVARLAAGTLAPGRAAEQVDRSMLGVYAAELRDSLAQYDAAAGQGFAARATGWAATARSVARLILAANLAERLGAPEADRLHARLDALAAKALRGELGGEAVQTARADAQRILADYAPVALSADEIRQKATLLSRLLGLTAMDYRDSIRGGGVSIPFEYQEALTFRDKSKLLFAELRPALAERSPELVPEMDGILADVDRAVTDKGDPVFLRGRADRGIELLGQSFQVSSGPLTVGDALALLPVTLDELIAAMRTGDAEAAEFKRIEAYAYFDPAIEQHLVPRSPTLAQVLESRFWEGTASEPGLQSLIASRAPVPALRAEVERTKADLGRASDLLLAEATPLASFLQAFTILLREGLEAVLVLAALVGTLRSMRIEGYAPWVGGGVTAGIVLSFVTWYLARGILQLTTADRELVEGLTGLLAAVVLFFVTSWIFRKSYVTDWVASIRRAAERAPAGRMLAFATLGFFVVYREGFETVLFYEAILSDGIGWAIALGFAAALVAILAVGYAIIAAGKRLPLKGFFAATGFILAFVILTFVGNGVRGLQTAGLVAATPVAGFPESPALQLYLGIYPLKENLTAQGAVLALLVGSWAWSRLATRQPSPRPAE
ncbi:FTR1 family protein [Marinivivus vitaminiproducens]|uniref:FTR1 family protein n=1 Tax=Marinivivus vitaminiproducens TaxID=3035935 RepID=UPI00279A02FC|nr:FTR1 family protein [Geminicoccaceae bacterium SCSIO 64248]